MKLINIKYINILIILTFLICLVFISANGLRGTDQYWYISAVDSYCKDINNSYMIFPYLSNYYDINSIPFPHDTAITKILGSISCSIDPYISWISLNVICMLIIFLSTYLCCKDKGKNNNEVLLISILTILNPATFWLLTQPLIEIILATLLILIFTVGMLIKNVVNKFLLIFFLIFFMDSIRTGYFYIAFILSIVLFISSFYHKKNKLFYIFLILFTILYSYFYDSNTLRFSIASLAMNGANDNGNMSLWLSYNLPTFDIILFKNKVLLQFFSFFSFSTLPFNFVFFFILFILLFLLIKYFKELKTDFPTFAVFIVLMLANVLYFTTVFIHQNQFRYQVIVLPSNILACYYIYANYSKSNLKYLSYFLFIISFLFCISSILLSIKSHESSFVSRKQGLEFKNKLKESRIFESDEIIITCYNSKSIENSYYIRPTLSFVIDSQGSHSYLMKSINIANSDVLICHDGAIVNYLLDMNLYYEVFNINSVRYYLFDLSSSKINDNSN